jgi:ribonuclease BN (tRNA processing enzyme)
MSMARRPAVQSPQAARRTAGVVPPSAGDFMAGFRLLPLGVGDAFSARYYSSCFALEAADQWLLVDCPHPIRKLLRDASAPHGFALDVSQIQAVVLTHLHADHASGLEGIGFYSRFMLNKRMPLIVPPAVSVDLWPHHLAGSMEWSLQQIGEPPAHRRLDDFFELITLEPGTVLPLGPYLIECRAAVHSIPTFALRVQAAGRTLGYSADTAFDPALVAWLADADLVVHEASGGFMHTNYEELAVLPAALRRKMRLIHYPDDFDPATATIEVLREGRFCTI